LGEHLFLEQNPLLIRSYCEDRHNKCKIKLEVDMNKSKVFKFVGLLLILVLFIAACSSNSADNKVNNNNDNQSDENSSDVDNSGSNVEENDVDTGNENESEEQEAEDVVEILGFSVARDFLADYFLSEYGIELVEPWVEQDLTPDGLVGSSTIRFVSGSVTIKMSAPVVAPENLIYTIEEASDISNGFYWEGTLSYFGEITESTVMLPGAILSDELARDAVLDHLTDVEFGEWADDGYSQSGDAMSIKTFTSGTWTVSVEFAPSAPLVASYHVTVENSTDGFSWEGDITLRGEITE
jgi:hypothetical protein